MTAMRVDFCSECNKPIATDHPFNLCPDCDSQCAKQSAWQNAPRLTRSIVRTLEVAAVILGLICGSVILWILKPAYYRAMRYPLSLLAILATAIAGYLAYTKAERIKKQIEKTAELWYGR